MFRESVSCALRHGRTIAIAVAAIALYCGASSVRSQEIGKLYAAKPPPGSAFVRVALPAEFPANKIIHLNATRLALAEGDAASRYVAAPGNAPLSIRIGGGSVKDTWSPLPGRFYTVAISQLGPDWVGQAIDEGAGDSNDLKAHLRFFNLAPDCRAPLQIDQGPVVLDGTNPGEFRSRSINPVQARLRSECNGLSATFSLPPLKSGDHYSLFLRRIGGEMVLSGQFDETEPYRAQ